MNMGKKDLDSWGRDKASKRYAAGGAVREKPASKDGGKKQKDEKK